MDKLITKLISTTLSAVQKSAVVTLCTVLSVLLFPSKMVQAQNYQPFQQHEQLRYYGYQFTTFPGTEAWRSLDMNADKHALLQIPEDTLRVISTQRLLETCLYYPMIMEVFAFDNLV